MTLSLLVFYYFLYTIKHLQHSSFSSFDSSVDSDTGDKERRFPDEIIALEIYTVIKEVESLSLNPNCQKAHVILFMDVTLCSSP